MNEDDLFGAGEPFTLNSDNIHEVLHRMIYGHEVVKVLLCKKCQTYHPKEEKCSSPLMLHAARS